jgi:hypothetical protein
VERFHRGKINMNKLLGFMILSMTNSNITQTIDIKNKIERILMRKYLLIFNPLMLPK